MTGWSYRTKKEQDEITKVMKETSDKLFIDWMCKTINEIALLDNEDVYRHSEELAIFRRPNVYPNSVKRGDFGYLKLD